MRRIAVGTAFLLMAGLTPRAGAQAAGARGGPGEIDELVGTLVDGALAAAQSVDPLGKARGFEEMARALAGAAERAAAARRHNEARGLAEQFARVAERGVYANVNKARGDGANGIERATRSLAERMGRHEQALARALELAPEEARAGLQKAIEVSKRGRERALEAVGGAAEGALSREDAMGLRDLRKALFGDAGAGVRGGDGEDEAEPGAVAPDVRGRDLPDRAGPPAGVGPGRRGGPPEGTPAGRGGRGRGR